MKLYAPKYYESFVCIAGKCRHSCCIGWEIDVDDDTMARYDALAGEIGKRIRESIVTDETPHFRLCTSDRCPHLDASGLCRIIREAGEEYLCDICREHPRFYNSTKFGKEVGLGMACEEACRLILASDGYADIAEVGTLDDDGADADGLDPLPLRDELYAVLADRTTPYPDRLSRIARTANVSLANRSDAQWRDLLSSLEYLSDEHKSLFAAFTADPSTPPEIEKPLERALAYFLYRHVTAARDEAQARAAVGLSLFLERLVASVAKVGAESLPNAARIVSEEIEYSEDNTDELRYAFLF